MKELVRIITVFFCVVVLSSFINESRPRIFLIGDSTMANKRPEAAPETGWGMMFPKYINAEIHNHAVNGRSTRSFRTLGHWAEVYNQLRKGDWVFIQFGHNDSKESDTARYAAPHTDYRKNLIRYIEEIRSKGANAILITPVMRRKFDEQGNFVDQHGDYPAVVKEVAKELHVPLIDLHAKSKEVIVSLGVEDSKKMFLNLPAGVWQNFPEGKEDNTHFTPYGADVVASLVAAGLKELDIDLSKEVKKIPVGDRFEYELPKVMEVAFKKDTFDVLSYGAKRDGITVNTNALQAAIEACHKSGGGTVLIPKGLWITGPISLKSNVNLCVSEGAVLQFSDNYDDYPLFKTNWEGVDAIRAQSPIYAADVENIAITGKGIIDGSGQAWRPVKKNKVTPPEWNALVKSGGILNDKQDTWYPTERALKGSQAKRPGVVSEGYTIENTASIKEFLRPNMVSIVNSKRVLLEGVTFQNSPAWCLHPLLTQHLIMRNVKVRNPWNAQNGDGVDIESCRYVKLENCSFDVGDDGICIKSGRDEEGRKRGVPTEDVSIKNCTVFHGHGGFVIGSEMSGGARNIFVSDCNFLGTDVGLRFKTTRGRGGVVEKIYVDNIRMANIGGAAILFDMYYMAVDPLSVSLGEEKPAVKIQPVDEGTPQFRDFYIRDIVCKGAETGIFVRGLPEMSIRNITMESISIESKTGFVCIEGDGITLKDATLFCKSDVAINIDESKNIMLDNIKCKPGNVFLSANGQRSKDITVRNTDRSSFKKELELGSGVSAKSIKMTK